MKDWKHETARDLMALGSIPFVIIVLARITMLGNFRQLFHIIVAILLVSIVSYKVKKISYHSSIIVILAIFTSLFYASYYFATFAAVITIGALYGIKTYLKGRVYLSAALGILCSIIAYLIGIPLNIVNL